MIDSIISATSDSFVELYASFLDRILSVIGALAVILIGWFVAVVLQNGTMALFKAVRLDTVLDKTGLGKVLEKGGAKLEFSYWISLLVKWFFIFVFLMAATNIMHWNQVTLYLKDVVGYIPNVIVAVLIIVIAAWAATVLQKIVYAAIGAGEVKGAGFAAALTKWSILIFGFLAALSQLGVVPGLIQTLITGFIAMLAIAGGLAFGLGAKDQAADFIEKLKKEIK